MIESYKKKLSKQWDQINQTLQRNNKQKHFKNKLITDNDLALTNKKDISNELNNFFINIGPNKAIHLRRNNTFSENKT